MGEIKGVLLCGGEGTRLRPLTYAVNKHLVRVGNLPMVEYPLRRMIEAGVKNIHVVTGGENYPGVVKYLGSGKNWDVRITYSIQDKPGGIAEALGMAEPFVDGNKMLVILGDNLFDFSIKTAVEYFANSNLKSEALFYSTRSKTPERFGVLVFDEHKRIIDVVEKPKNPPSDEIVVGIYCYTSDVFDVIRTLKPSARGELEITDVNRHYIDKRVAMSVPCVGNWTDCGSFETLAIAEEIFGLKVKDSI